MLLRLFRLMYHRSEISNDDFPSSSRHTYMTNGHIACESRSRNAYLYRLYVLIPRVPVARTYNELCFFTDVSTYLPTSHCRRQYYYYYYYYYRRTRRFEANFPTGTGTHTRARAHTHTLYIIYTHVA